ncbi:MAG: hypothetical protein U0L98_01735 [Clostridia bacterium]|nr:hypothetical protein [Clostridia bacterium]
MKQIEICGKKYEIECNALTYVKYKSIFKTGIVKDMSFIQNYLIKQSVISSQYEENKNLSDSEKLSQISNYMIDDTDEFVTKITQIAWILIYTANNKIESYEDWLKSITNFKIDDDWIVEVTEYAVDCFC